MAQPDLQLGDHAVELTTETGRVFTCSWDSRITIAFGDRLVELLLGEAADDDRPVPSADNIAVLFSPGPSPS